MNVGWDHLSNATGLVNLKLLEKVIVGLVEDTVNSFEVL